MDLARVVGTVVASVKDPQLHGIKLMLVRPANPEGEFTGPAFIALDAIGAGPGETVFYVTGREASFAFLPDSVPADAAIVGIVDTVDESTDRRGARRRR